MPRQSYVSWIIAEIPLINVHSIVVCMVMNYTIMMFTCAIEVTQQTIFLAATNFEDLISQDLSLQIIVQNTLELI